MAIPSVDPTAGEIIISATTPRVAAEFRLRVPLLDFFPVLIARVASLVCCRRRGRSALLMAARRIAALLTLRSDLRSDMPALLMTARRIAGLLSRRKLARCGNFWPHCQLVAGRKIAA